MKKISLIIILLFFCFSVSYAQLPQCVAPKLTTLPLSGDYGGFGKYAVSLQTIANPDSGAPAPVTVFVPENASAQNKLPVIFFAHGFGGFSYLFYESLLRQLASNGYIVIFAPYTPNILVSNSARYNQMWSGFLAAAQQDSAIMDLSKVGFAGHSYGAGAVTEMARRGISQGWGANGIFLFLMAAWYNWGTNLEQIPASAKMVVQIYWEDGTNDSRISQNDIWNKLPQITEKKWQIIRTSRIYCELTADHGLPVTNGLGQTDAVTNAYDAWGVWRRIHALSDYTFTGNQTAKNIAFGTDSFMGRWRGIFGIRRIAPLESYDTPVINSQINAKFPWSAKCLYALGSPCS